jgi:hypothetical protein
LSYGVAIKNNCMLDTINSKNNTIVKPKRISILMGLSFGTPYNRRTKENVLGTYSYNVRGGEYYTNLSINKAINVELCDLKYKYSFEASFSYTHNEYFLSSPYFEARTKQPDITKEDVFNTMFLINKTIVSKKNNLKFDFAGGVYHLWQESWSPTIRSKLTIPFCKNKWAVSFLGEKRKLNTIVHKLAGNGTFVNYPKVYKTSVYFSVGVNYKIY